MAKNKFNAVSIALDAQKLTKKYEIPIQTAKDLAEADYVFGNDDQLSKLNKEYKKLGL